MSSAGRFSEARYMFQEIGLKVGALFTYCGGPLFVADLLKPRIGTASAFWITFFPVGLTVLGALFMDDWSSRWLYGIVRAGRVALFVVLGMHVYAVWCFALGVRTPDQILHYIGLVAGALWTVYYVRKSRRWDRVTADAEAHDPHSPKPIEPS